MTPPLKPISGDQADLSPYMTEEAESDTAVRRTNSGGIKARNIELLDGILDALGIKYTFPDELGDDGLFLKNDADGQLVWAPAQGAPGIQGPPGPSTPAPPPTTSLPFTSITGLLARQQLPRKFEPRMRFISHG